MTEQQWQSLLRVLDGERLDPLPVGMIIDSPWLPGWAGMSILDYYTSEQKWLDANLQAVGRFPEIMFLPGFWSEFGMCTEPSAFGARCVFPENEFPFAGKVLGDPSDVARLKKPDCRTDGLLPFVIKRLAHTQAKIEQQGHAIRFAVARGPHNIASFLLGHTELLMAVKIHPDETHKLLEIVTEFLVDWLVYQKEMFPSIDGFLLLDDLIGFVGDADFQTFVLPYFKHLYGSMNVRVKALHNDAHGMVTAKHLAEMGVNLFNFSFEHGLAEMRKACGKKVTLLGNIPPRDVLVGGTPEDVERAAAEALAPVDDRRRIVLSAGGGCPPDVPTENIEALCRAAKAGPDRNPGTQPRGFS